MANELIFIGLLLILARVRAIGEVWIKENISHYDHIESRCLGPNAPPLRSLIPQIDFFNEIVKMVEHYDYPIALLMGRGTTGTRAVNDFIFEQGWTTLHYRFVAWNPVYSDGGMCMYGKARPLSHDTATIAMNGPKGRKLTSKHLSEFLSCKKAGPLLIGDSPWVNIFTELYLATCAVKPATVVFLTERNPRDWMKSRAQNHDVCRVCFLCPQWEKRLDMTPDPFSYTQCGPKGMKNGYSAAVEEELAWLNRTARWSPEKVQRQGIRSLPALGRAFDRYNKYVRALVPANRIIPLDLFDKSRKWKEMVSETMLYQLAKFNQS